MTARTGRPPNTFVLAEVDVIEIRGVLSGGRVEYRTAKRARALLLRAEGMAPKDVALRTDLDESTVFRICQRYQESGLGALYDAPRSGRPPRFSP